MLTDIRESASTSGICGWACTDAPQEPVLRSMAHLLPNFSAGAPLARGSGGALACSARAIARDSHWFAAVDAPLHWIDDGLVRRAAAEGDAAVLLHVFRDRGVDTLQAFRGHYALALVRADGAEALLAVDRIGVRPMSYALTSRGLVFASNVNALRQHPATSSALNPQAIYDYLYFNVVPSPLGVYADQRKLEPAQYLHYRNGRATTAYYWVPRFADDAPADAAALTSELHRGLRAAVRRGLPQTGAGAFLSGGLDSSTVCGVLAEVDRSQARSFSIGFDVPGYDEIGYVRIAARRFGLDAHEYYVTPRDVADAVALVAREYDEPFGNSSALAVYHCARLAKRHGVNVLLAGDGGDEIFAGNERYAKQQIFELYGRLPRAVRRLLLEPLAFGVPGGGRIAPLRKLRRYIEQARVPLPQRLETYNLLHMLPLGDIFEPEFLHAVDPQHPIELMRASYERCDAHDALDRMLYLDWKFTLADNDLRKVNHMCAAAGVAVRYPMLDDELVELSIRIPPRLKMRRFELRHFYKRALRDFLPPEIIAKPKHGFGLPFGEWLRTVPELKDIAYAALRAHTSRGYLRSTFVEEMIRAHRADHAGFYGSMIWTVMMLELWLQSRAVPRTQTSAAAGER